MLDKTTLNTTLMDKFKELFLSRASKAQDGDEDEDPKSVCEQLAKEMAKVISDAVDVYVKGGEITIGPTNIAVTSPTGACTVTPGTPAKIT